LSSGEQKKKKSRENCELVEITREKEVTVEIRMNLRGQGPAAGERNLRKGVS
jgi:hypothetical protein